MAELQMGGERRPPKARSSIWRSAKAANICLPPSDEVLAFLGVAGLLIISIAFLQTGGYKGIEVGSAGSPSISPPSNPNRTPQPIIQASAEEFSGKALKGLCPRAWLKIAGNHKTPRRLT